MLKQTPVVSVLVGHTITRIEVHVDGADRTRVGLVAGRCTEMVGGHAEPGWRQSFEKLAALLAG